MMNVGFGEMNEPDRRDCVRAWGEDGCCSHHYSRRYCLYACNARVACCHDHRSVLVYLSPFMALDLMLPPPSLNHVRRWRVPLQLELDAAWRAILLRVFLCFFWNVRIDSRRSRCAIRRCGPELCGQNLILTRGLFVKKLGKHL